MVVVVKWHTRFTKLPSDNVPTSPAEVLALEYTASCGSSVTTGYGPVFGSGGLVPGRGLLTVPMQAGTVELEVPVSTVTSGIHP